MAKKISELTSATTLGATDVVALVQGTETKKITAQITADNTPTLNSNIVTKTGTQVLTNKNIDTDNNTVSNLEVDNLKTGVLNTDLESGTPTDTELPSALAVKTLTTGISTITGELKIWTTDSAPTGWLISDGTAVSRTTYANLFAVISTTYGVGDGSTTFNLPDLTNNVAVGKGSGVFNALGNTGGSETHTLTESEMPAHTHNLSTFTTSASGATDQIAGTDAKATALALNGLSSTGGGAAHNILQPYLVINYIIKT